MNWTKINAWGGCGAEWRGDGFDENPRIREIEGTFWYYYWSQSHGQCQMPCRDGGMDFAGGQSDGSVKYVGRAYKTLNAAKKAATR